MKKNILFLFTLFAMTTFANEISSGNSEANMNVTATVIQPLTVISNGDLNFGKVLPGAPSAGAFSSFSIEGHPDSNVKISFSGINRAGNYSYYSDLKSTSTDDTLLLAFNCSPTGGGYLPTNPSITLDSSGKYTLNVSANVQSRPDQTPAKYTGTIKLRAIYE
ncbi:DUF4402 domain-containing protein [Cetobacterium sp. 8H]|uniref:DUF4402 domain-containing protein n=1 Tax=Cetobacterium sp. 8H TaxID=2759681 RepID=UPI00163CF6EE|nr:DUF4402 domain-containing protein [Cetobacterium sp. 8H]MBC2851840.1 DUF4402 domain-containing protein [Cetobacterium sp. 8H]